MNLLSVGNIDINGAVMFKGPGQDWCKVLCKPTDLITGPSFILPILLLGFIHAATSAKK